MKKKYKVKESFAGILISASEGDVIELTAEEAKSYAPFIEVVPASQVIETAELKAEPETADIKAPRRKK